MKVFLETEDNNIPAMSIVGIAPAEAECKRLSEFWESRERRVIEVDPETLIPVPDFGRGLTNVYRFPAGSGLRSGEPVRVAREVIGGAI